MKLFIRAKFIGPLGLFIASAGGCTVSTAPESAPTSTVSQGVETAATPESHAEEAEQQREPYGPVAHIADALAKVGLNEEQRAAAEKLGKEVAEKEKAVVDAREGLKVALAKQLKEGKIDEQALEHEIDALVKAREAASPALRKAVENLHGILNEEQRGDFVDALKSRMKDLDQASQKWFGELSKDLRLTEEQRNKAKDVLEKTKGNLAEEHKKAEALFEAFKGKEFKIERIVPISDVGERTRKRATEMIGIAKELTDILTPEQRSELAKKLEAKHPSEPLKGVHMPKIGGHETEAAPLGEAQQGIIVGGGYRAGAVRGWGGGYSARSMTVSGGGYAAGYPFIGGYGMGIW